MKEKKLVKLSKVERKQLSILQLELSHAQTAVEDILELMGEFGLGYEGAVPKPMWKGKLKHAFADATTLLNMLDEEANQAQVVLHEFDLLLDEACGEVE